jgi:hypothetical protein
MRTALGRKSRAYRVKPAASHAILTVRRDKSGDRYAKTFDRGAKTTDRGDKITVSFDKPRASGVKPMVSFDKPIGRSQKATA